MDIQLPETTISVTAENTKGAKGGYLLIGSNVTINLPDVPVRLYRHGWQSWSLAAWLDPSAPPVPISSPEFRTKDEDPVYALSNRHTSAWVSAVELPDGSIILLGALNLGGRIELEGTSLHGFSEGNNGEWFLGQGTEEQAFSSYTTLLAGRFGKNHIEKTPRVWCSWYSLYGWVNEKTFLRALNGLGDLPFDVVQLDDGWEIHVGDWEPNKKFPSGMTALAEKIQRTGRTPGIWLAPFMATQNSFLYRSKPDWFLRDEHGNPVRSGLAWNGPTYALDSSHPAVLEWMDKLIRKVRGWGYGYLKLDFLSVGALPGKRIQDIPREVAYRKALEVIRNAAGDAYILACGAPVVPSLGLCDGLRVGPDVTPYWINTPMSIWLNNPNHPSAQNAIRTSLNRLWLQPLVHTDPDMVYFRSRHNALTQEQNTYLRDVGLLSHFKATSDLPGWLKQAERQALREFLLSSPQIEHLGRYCFRIDGRIVDFAKVMSLPNPKKVPARLATALGLYDMVIYEVLPALLEMRKIK